jgi:hypothetical protein
VYTTLTGIPGATYINPTGINDSGQIVGYYGYFGVQLGFLYSGGIFTTCSDPSAANGVSEPLAINDSGQIAGSYENSSGTQYAFVATPSVVPEPSSLLLCAIGGVGAFVAWRHRKAATA